MTFQTEITKITQTVAGESCTAYMGRVIGTEGRVYFERMFKTAEQAAKSLVLEVEDCAEFYGAGR